MRPTDVCFPSHSLRAPAPRALPWTVERSRRGRRFTTPRLASAGERTIGRGRSLPRIGPVHRASDAPVAPLVRPACLLAERRPSLETPRPRWPPASWKACGICDLEHLPSPGDELLMPLAQSFPTSRDWARLLPVSWLCHHDPALDALSLAPAHRAMTLRPPSACDCSLGPVFENRASF